MAPRVTYRKRSSYHTASNATRVVKTPGGRHVVQYKKKQVQHPRCAVSGVVLQGLPARRPAELSSRRLSRRHKSVSRVYGGQLSHAVVRERIVRAFLIEEQKIVKRVLKLQAAKEAKEGKK